MSNSKYKLRVGRRALPSENLEHNWEWLDLNGLEIPQDDNVWLLGGNTTNEGSSANGNAKIIESVMDPAKRKRTNIYSFMYEAEPLDSNCALLPEYEEEMRRAFEMLFKPKLYDRSGNIKSKKGIETFLQKQTFVAHCGGSNFVNIIIDEIYNCIEKEYSEAEANFLIKKVQYYAYAPSELPRYDVSAFMVMPYADQSYSWSKGLKLAEEQDVEVDFPRGIVRRLLKSKRQGNLRNEFESLFESERALTFKIGQTTFLIPSQMNTKLHIGDHSIDCLTSPSVQDSGTEFATTAKLTRSVSSFYLDQFVSDTPIDYKRSFNKVSKMIEKTSQNHGEFA